jgi:hypothetical protein
MKTRVLVLIPAICLGMLTFFQCNEKKTDEKTILMGSGLTETREFNGFESQIKWGEHLITVGACHDCHTPKKMTEFGPVLDSARWLSGHPAGMPGIDIDRKMIQQKGLVVTATLTEWVGPWGVSYAANLTPDGTGIGTWTEEQFFTALREGKSKGIASARSLLPPMPWDMYRHLTDAEIKAVFAYLKSVKPISNIVPAPVPPGI